MEVPPPCSTLQASRGEEERCKPGRRSRGATEASWGVGGGFQEGEREGEVGGCVEGGEGEKGG